MYHRIYLNKKIKTIKIGQRASLKTKMTDQLVKNANFINN